MKTIKSLIILKLIIQASPRKESIKKKNYLRKANNGLIIKRIGKENKENKYEIIVNTLEGKGQVIQEILIDFIIPLFKLFKLHKTYL